MWDPSGHRPVDADGDEVPYCDWHKCSKAQKKSTANEKRNYKKAKKALRKAEKHVSSRPSAAQVTAAWHQLYRDLAPEAAETWIAGEKGRTGTDLALVRSEFLTFERHRLSKTCDDEWWCRPFANSDVQRFVVETAAGGAAFKALGESLALAKAGVTASQAGFRLGEASDAAFSAARTPAAMFIKNKHLASAMGRQAKFATDDIATVQQWISRGLRSDNVQFLSNGIEGTFRAIISNGRSVGTKGQTNIRVILTNNGRVINAFPVKVR